MAVYWGWVVKCWGREPRGALLRRDFMGARSTCDLHYGSWARVYAMLVALSLGQLLILWRLRTRAAVGPVVACAVLEAAMLYTHLGSVLFLGAESAMLARGAWRGERNGAGWAALALGAIAFAPFVPIASLQIHELLAGHWLDWLGYSIRRR